MAMVWVNYVSRFVVEANTRISRKLSNAKTSKKKANSVIYANIISLSVYSCLLLSAVQQFTVSMAQLKHRGFFLLLAENVSARI